MKFSRSWLWLLLLIPLGLGIGRLRFDTEILNLLPKNLPSAEGLRLYQHHFSNARELMVTVESPTAEETETTARALAELLRAQSDLVNDVIWQPVWLENPAQIMELLGFLWLNQPPTVFGELTNRLAEENRASTLQETRERLATSLSPNDLAFGAYDPYGLTKLPDSVAGAAPAMGSGEELFVSEDRKFRLMFVEAKPDLSDYQACQKWLVQIRELVSQARHAGRIPANAEVHYTGRPAFVAEISSGMENDMRGLPTGTLAVIGLCFWLTHRRLLPLFWLVVLLLGTLCAALAVGGLFIGTINIVSLGFASILLGLAEDFGIIIYQETRSHPELKAPQLRREVAPGILWSAVTTAGAFLLLNLSALPGLGQLGTLVAIGILLAAVVMMFAYSPLVMQKPAAVPPTAVSPQKWLLFNPIKLLPPQAVWTITAFLVFSATLLLWTQGLNIDHSPDPLKPNRSEAYSALDKIRVNLTRSEEPLWVIVSGRNEAEVARKLTQINAELEQSVSNGILAGFKLPTLLWPQPQNQQANRDSVAHLLSQREALRAAALQAGFTKEAFVATDNIFNTWQAALSTDVFWPTNRASQWILSRFVAHQTNGLLALGMLQPAAKTAALKAFASDWSGKWTDQGVILSGWELLGSTVFDLVLRELPRVLIPVFLLVVFSLWLAFRNIWEVLLSLWTVLFSGLCLFAVMNLLGWRWNMLNMMAVPLLLGLWVDFNIHIQLGLRRYKGDLLEVRRSIGKALLLAGTTTVAGFGSLAFSSNAGMASLGKVCGLGITVALLTSVYLLPVWWKAFYLRKRATPPTVCW